jgi:hypothetical protein
VLIQPHAPGDAVHDDTHGMDRFRAQLDLLALTPNP